MATVAQQEQTLSAQEPVPGCMLVTDPRRFFEARGDRSAWIAEPEGARRIADLVVDRPPGYWLTNVPQHVLRTAGLDRRHDLKPDDFLGSSVSAILADNGLGPDSAIGLRATLLQRVFAKVMDLARDAYGLPPDPPSSTLPLAIREHFFRRRSTADMPPEVRYALQQSVQALTVAGATGGRLANERIIPLRFHRQEYAARMMSHQVPYGEWSKANVPSDPQRALQWARDLLETRPLLLRADVKFRGPHAHELALLANLGSGAAAVYQSGGQKRANVRSWIGGPELLVLSQNAEITIHDALVADRYVMNPWAALSTNLIGLGPANATMQPCGPLALHGRALVNYPIGLLAEASWMALASSKDADPVGAWMTSFDRASCLQTAIAVLAMAIDGVRVSSYTKGRVWIKVADDSDEEHVWRAVSVLSKELRLVPPVMPQAPDSGERVELASRMVQEAQDADRAVFDPLQLMLAGAILGGDKARKSLGVG